MSVEYHKRLERGQVPMSPNWSSSLFDLVRAVSPIAATRARPVKMKIGPIVQRILDRINAPATVRNQRLDHLGANSTGRALRHGHPHLQAAVRRLAVRQLDRRQIPPLHPPASAWPSAST
jgi:hypothetical protein